MYNDAEDEDYKFPPNIGYVSENKSVYFYLMIGSFLSKITGFVTIFEEIMNSDSLVINLRNEIIKYWLDEDEMRKKM